MSSPRVKSEEAPEETAQGEEIQGDWTTANWDHHNGGVTQHYAWSQSPQDVELKMALLNPNIKASDLKIDIKPYSLKVCFLFYCFNGLSVRPAVCVLRIRGLFRCIILL